MARVSSTGKRQRRADRELQSWYALTMSILANLKDSIGMRLGAAVVRRNPVLKAAALRSLDIWTTLELDRAFNAETRGTRWVNNCSYSCEVSSRTEIRS